MSLVRGLTEVGAKAAKKTAPFYSAVDEALANLKRPKGTGAEFLTEVMKTKGVKKAEIADRKLEEAFKAKGKMTKEEAQQVLKDNPPSKLQERVIDDTQRLDEEELKDIIAHEMYGKPYDQVYNQRERSRVFDEAQRRMDTENGTRYGDYITPGGENYREILLKLPEAFTSKEMSRMLKLEADLRRGELPTNEMQELLALQSKKKNSPKAYQSSHWSDDPNILAHMRVQDRVGPNGEKVLHVEEIQSDWHQEGRKKGYGPKIDKSVEAYYETKDGQRIPVGFGKTKEEAEASIDVGWKNLVDIKYETIERKIGEGVPDAPFKKNWHELAMKRLLNYAADKGYDSIAITPGAEQVKRYSLAKQLDEVQFDPNTGHLSGRDHNGKLVVAQKGVTMDNLSDYIGKEGAQKILQTPVDELGVHSLRGADLEVGGEGMKGFYDQILPTYLNTFGKPYGAQVGTINMNSPRGAPAIEEIQRLSGMNQDQWRAMTGDQRVQLSEKIKNKLNAEGMPLHNFPITPEMREQIKQKGLPLYQQIGIPTAGAGAASQALQPEEEQGLSGGGMVNSAIKQAHLAKLAKMRQEMAPRAEAIKNLIAKDANAYLRDVVPNSLTNPEIEAEIARMAAKAKAAGQQEGVLPMAQRDANLAKFLEESQIKDKLYRGQRRAPKADRFITTQGRATPSFTDNPDVANVYSQQLGWDIAHGPGSTSVPVHVQMKKPFDIRSLGEHVTLEEFLNKLDHDLTVPRSPDKIGYEDLADILGTLDFHVFKGNAKHNIDATDNRGTFRVRSFEQLADEVNDAGRKKNISRILDELLPDATIDTYALADSPEVVKQLKKLGYDSMIHKDVFDAGMPYYKGDPTKIGEGYDADHIIDAYRPFEQSKIKSAIGNRGTYDINEPDITKSGGGAIAKMALKAAPAPKAPQIIKPSGLTELKKIVEQEKGGYGARRLERAADEIPNLEKMYQQGALREAFTGDNAQALMTMNPADFEKYAVQLNFKTNRPNYPSLEERIRQGVLDKHDLPTDEYIKFLRTLPHGFEDVPFLAIDKQEYGLPLVPSITGHEGRHRSRALTESGEKSSLVRLLPNPELREPLPRRSQQEYIDALKKELEMTGNKVVPEDYGTTRPPIILPDVYAKGGSVKRKVKKADGGAINFNTVPDMSDGGRIIEGAPFKHGGKVNIMANRDAMFMELSNKKLKRK